MKFNLEFHPQSESPTELGNYLIYNQCDGYHEVEALFGDDGAFDCFYSLGMSAFEADSYVAWAKLPDSTALYERFADKPRDGMSAREVCRERLKRQREPGFV